MKTVAVVLLLALGCLAIIANASPVPSRTSSEAKKQDGALSRQAAAPAAPAAEEEDDDDDDDDDDIGGIADVEYDEDDEDDDAEEDDDDDEDYLERFIDDILGGEDDDDDDDETVAVVEPVQPASPVHTQATAIPASVQSDLNADEAANVADSAVEVNDSTGSYEEDVQPEGQAVSSLEGAESVANPVVVNQAAPVSAPSQTVDSDEDDDDDEDDDLDLDITEDEDSEEDDEEYEEDADEETDEIEDIADIADARRARAMEGETTGDVSAIYVAKYNRFVDNILGRINKILRANYDPVTVKLSNPSSKPNKTKTKRKKIKTKSKVSSRDSSISESTTKSSLEIQSTEASTVQPDVSVEGSISSRASGISSKDHKLRKTGTKTKNKATTSATNKNKVKQTKPKSKSKAKATLYGLSSLKRAGDVSVNMMSDHTTIRTKFNLGPLVLKVEKEFGRAAKKELRSATATTAEMSGKLSLRVLHGGAATLHSIRVLQPKQVRVDSPDDHDRTREFVWRRSSHIAHLVSQKLSSATRSMLRPPPITTVTA